MTNPHERAHRLEKAVKLANIAEAIGAASSPPIGPADVAAAWQNLLTSDPHWEELARRAEVNVPSATSRKLVIQLLKDRAKAAGVVLQRSHPLPYGPCDWSCGTRATITLKASDGKWYRCCGKCWASLGVRADSCLARTIQGG